MNFFGTAVTRSPNLLLENLVVLRLSLSFLFEKKVGIFCLKKKRDGRLPRGIFFDQSQKFRSIFANG